MFGNFFSCFLSVCLILATIFPDRVSVGASVGAKGGHLGAVPPLAVINAPPTTGHYFIYFPDNDRGSIHYPLYYTGLLML